MVLKQNINVFLNVEQYRAVKNLAHKLDVPYVHLVRRGIDLLLEKYQKETPKTV